MRTNLPCPQHATGSASTGRRGARAHASATEQTSTPPVRLAPDGRIAVHTSEIQALPWSVIYRPDSEDAHAWLAEDAVADWVPLTPATTDRSKLGRANRQRGHDAERAVARWLRDNGFPHAERAVRTGYTTGKHTAVDPGDLTGTPGIVWQIKDDASNAIEQWLAETEAQRQGGPGSQPADLGLLVVRRRGKAEPGRWWVWLPTAALFRILTDHWQPGLRSPVCMELRDLTPLLRAAGFGDPLENEGQKQ